VPSRHAFEVLALRSKQEAVLDDESAEWRAVARTLPKSAHLHAGFAISFGYWIPPRKHACFRRLKPSLC